MRLFRRKPRYWDYPTLPAGESYDVVERSMTVRVDISSRGFGKRAALEQMVEEFNAKGIVVHQSKPEKKREVSWEDICNRRWSRQEVIEIARIARIILPSDYTPPKPPPEPEMSKALVKSHRGRAYQSDRDGKTLAKPADLENIVRQLKVLGIPFLMVTVKSAGMSGTHGWCNDGNWGKTILEELARCAELNFKQEMEKCHGMDHRPANEKPYSGKIPGEYLSW